MLKMAISQTIRSASPFLKWAGGKTQLLPALLKNIPTQFGTYIEPFVGGGALFFELQPAKAILADSNPELINCYIVVRDNVEDLVTVLSAYPYSEEFYYKLRAEVPGDAILRAARIIYLNRTCYNGLYRVNKRGQFNVPFGSYKNPIICDAERLRAASYTLTNTELFCADYQETLRNFAKQGIQLFAIHIASGKLYNYLEPRWVGVLSKGLNSRNFLTSWSGLAWWNLTE